jgi:hypothetical protein
LKRALFAESKVVFGSQKSTEQFLGKENVFLDRKRRTWTIREVEEEDV